MALMYRMIPYFQFTHFFIGPLRIQVWGLFVALGILVGSWLALREVRRQGLDAVWFERMAFWVIVWSFVGARLGHVLFYEPLYYARNVLEIFAVWHGGFSSFGGFIGAAIAGWVMLRTHYAHIMRYLDCGAYGLSAGWTIGRIGCFMIHDHPGTLSDFVLAVKQPDGGARHDLGLYDGLLTLGIFFILIFMRRNTYPTGMMMAVTMVVYGVVRFFLDFLRVADARVLHLTPAQYLSVLLVVGGIVLGKRALKNK